VFSRDHANITCNFFEYVLKHTQDEWSGKPFLLAPWQEEALTQIFGNLDDDGNRIIQMVYLEVPKKACKNGNGRPDILLSLLMDSHLGCQVYVQPSASEYSLSRRCFWILSQNWFLASLIALTWALTS
jgi:phage terminase large subunit-like protein